MSKSEALEKFEKTVDYVSSNPFEDRKVLLSMFLDAALDVWNEDVAGDVELDDGSFVTVQPILNKGY